MIDIIPLATPTLGDRSYVATDGTVAVVVDPQRDIDRVLDVLRDRNLQLTHVLETHLHNDYVTGGPELASRTGADYVVPADSGVQVPHTAFRDGDAFDTGRLRLRALHTPGHTFTHLSYVLEADEQVRGVFTGGSLLFGSTGRPDLLGAEHTETLARQQHASAHRLVTELPGDTAVLPTHGFGSFCSSTQSEASAATLADEARSNPVLTRDVEAYLQELLDGLGAYPAYYVHMAPVNAAGPAPVDLGPPEPADADQVRRRIAAGEWVVDLRSRTAFAAGHVPGALTYGLDGKFVTYLGWTIPWGTPVTLLGETAEQVAEAQRELVRIGIDRPAAAATGSPEDWAGGAPLASFPVADFAALTRADRSRLLVLDVRREEERRGGAVAGSLHVPLHDLTARLAEIPTDRTLWVHCASGYRASIAAGLLARAGRDVVLVDDDFAAAESAGLVEEVSA